MVDVYKVFGNCFMFDFEYIPDPDVDDLINDYMKRHRMKGFWCECKEDDKYGVIHNTVRLIVFDTYQVKARDLCFLLDGGHFRKLDPFTLAYICKFLGIELKDNVMLYDLSFMFNNYDLMA